MNIQVQRADSTHLEAVAQLFDAYRGFYEQPSPLRIPGLCARYRLLHVPARSASGLTVLAQQPLDLRQLPGTEQAHRVGAVTLP